MMQLSYQKKGKGSLCSTIVTANDGIATEYILGAGSHQEG